MDTKEQILEQIRKERAELEKFRKELADLLAELKADPNFSNHKCAVLIKELQEELKSCLNKKSGGQGDSDGKSGSVYERIFHNSPKNEKDKDIGLPKKKSNSPLKPQI